MATSAFVRYLQPAGQARSCTDGSLPNALGICADGSTATGVTATTGDPAADALARRNQDFQLAGTITTALANLTRELATGIITADTTRQANQLLAQTAQATRSLSAYGNDPAAMALLQRLQGGVGGLPPSYQQQYMGYQQQYPYQQPNNNRTLLIVGGVALAAAAAVGVVMLAKRPQRRNPVVGRGRNRHYVKPKAKARKHPR